VPRHASADLRRPEIARRVIEGADLVIHLAANVGGIGYNERYPGTLFFDNAMMGMNVIEACRLEGVRKVVVAGTVCAYPKLTPLPFREDHLWDGYPEGTNAPYGIAKKGLLVMLQAYRRQYGLNGIFLLLVNLYGPYDDFDPERSHVIPGLIRKFDEARACGAPEVTLWGDGSPTREFLFVEDAARGLAMAAERYDGAEPVNLGSAEELSIRELADMIQRKVGYTGGVVWDRSRPNGQPRRKLDVTRAAAAFGFRVETPLAAGLDRTIAWWRAHGAGR
jgi:GDP-L-fucose synthase